MRSRTFVQARPWIAWLYLLVSLSLASGAKAQNILAQTHFNGVFNEAPVNVALSKVYLSNLIPSIYQTLVVDGQNLDLLPSFPFGQGVSIDLQTDQVWLAERNGVVDAYDGTTNENTATVTTAETACGGLATAFDCNLRRVWAGFTCTGGNDPIVAIDADTATVIGSPILTGGVLAATPPLVNPATGRLYISVGGVTYVIDPTTFAMSKRSFDTVRAINPLTNYLYATNGFQLQIINGKPKPEVVLTTLYLPYAPSSLGVNTAFGHLYLADPDHDLVEIRSATTGAFLASVPLGAGNSPTALGVDSSRGRIYVFAKSGPPDSLFEIEDVTGARNCLGPATNASPAIAVGGGGLGTGQSCQ